MSRPNIFVFGPSGTGKSTSFRNLDPETTAIINTEQKALPFPGAIKFKNKDIKTYTEFHATLQKAMENPAIKTVIIESFTSLIEHIYRDAIKAYTGYDIWSYYKTEVGKCLNAMKNTSKNIICTGIDATLAGAGGVEERFIAVEGFWKKLVEKEFVIVLYSNMYTNAEGKSEYRFITNKQQGFENVSCKSPMEMFPATVPNDLKLVLDYVDKYYAPVPQNTSTAAQ